MHHFLQMKKNITIGIIVLLTMLMDPVETRHFMIPRKKSAFWTMVDAFWDKVHAFWDKVDYAHEVSDDERLLTLSSA